MCRCLWWVGVAVVSQWSALSRRGADAPDVGTVLPRMGCSAWRGIRDGSDGIQGRRMGRSIIGVLNCSSHMPVT